MILPPSLTPRLPLFKVYSRRDNPDPVLRDPLPSERVGRPLGPGGEDGDASPESAFLEPRNRQSFPAL